MILFLDIDGVLATSPPWKMPLIVKDGYSQFAEECVNNLNQLLDGYKLEIWLSSTRRTAKTLGEMNGIFKRRGISQAIHAYVPITNQPVSRAEELERFISKEGLTNFLILDDDSSLGGLSDFYKERWVQTELTRGFTKEKLEEARKKFYPSRQ